MYQTRFFVAYALVGLVLAGTVAWALGYATWGAHTRTVTHTVTKPAAKLDGGATVAKAEAGFSGQPQAIDGSQLGMQAGVTCDAYSLADGLVLVCHK